MIQELSLNKMRKALVALLAMAVLPCANAQVSTGTGFAVAPGLLITTHHVIDGCTAIEVVSADGRRRAAVVDADPLIDLALLRVPGLRGAAAKIRTPSDVRLGEPVMVFGFPLSGSLTSGGNFTSGLVSGLRGWKDSVGEIQITAPVQPGNSGGPVMDASGSVVGVVVSKLNAKLTAIATGDIPQNVNFAVSLDILTEFLAKNKTPVRDAPATKPLDTALVAELAQSFTYRVECMGSAQQAGSTPKPGTRPSPGTTIKDCADCPEMVVIPAGSFEMGSYDDASRPVHRVNIAGFLMGKTEITQGQWKAVMGSNPSSFGSCGDDCPVESVSWNDAQEFVQRLSQKTGKQYRLPSEAEWEYAARAGSTTKYSFGDADAQLTEYAWYGTNKTQRVAQKRPNAFGLFDMHGNVWEWTQDCWNANYSGAPTDGSAWTTGCSGSRVLRGGSWIDIPVNLRSATRSRNWPFIRFNGSGIGLRLARTP